MPSAILRWVPLGGSIMVGALFWLCWWGTNEDMAALAGSSCPGVHQAARIGAARLQWGSAVFAATVVMVALFVASATSFFREAMGRGPMLTTAALCLFLPFAAYTWPNSFYNNVTAAEVALIQDVSNFNAGPRLLTFLCTLVMTCILLAVVLGSFMVRARGSTSLTELFAMRRWLRTTLTATTVWLIIGVIGIAMFHRLAVACLCGEAAESLEAIATASTIYAGTLYSSLMAATFGPVELFLRTRARELAPKSLLHSEKAANEWLAEQGFDFSLPQELKGALAVFAPLLTGVLQGLANLV